MGGSTERWPLRASGAAAMREKVILVIGGAGYIGSQCCKAFAASGWRVVVFDNLSTGWRDFVQWGELIEGDILDQGALEAAFEKVRPVAVAHFAALANVGESVADPALYYRTNVVGSMNVLDAMRRQDCRQLVFSSTCATYGVPRYLPLDEEHPQAPINPYGQSKLAVERMLVDYARAYGLRYVGLRYFNAAGADPDGDVGERHEPETHVIPLAIQGADDPAYEFTVFGDDYETRDGTALRDYVHVADLADAHCKALDYLDAEGASGFFNLGTGAGTTVAEIAAAVEKVSNRKLRKRVGARRPGDPAVLTASATRAAEALNWKPTRLDVVDAVRDAWRWRQIETDGDRGE